MDARILALLSRLKGTQPKPESAEEAEGRLLRSTEQLEQDIKSLDAKIGDQAKEVSIALKDINKFKTLIGNIIAIIGKMNELHDMIRQSPNIASDMHSGPCGEFMSLRTHVIELILSIGDIEKETLARLADAEHMLTEKDMRMHRDKFLESLNRAYEILRGYEQFESMSKGIKEAIPEPIPQDLLVYKLRIYNELGTLNGLIGWGKGAGKPEDYEKQSQYEEACRQGFINNQKKAYIRDALKRLYQHARWTGRLYRIAQRIKDIKIQDKHDYGQDIFELRQLITHDDLIMGEANVIISKIDEEHEYFKRILDEVQYDESQMKMTYGPYNHNVLPASWFDKHQGK